MPYRKHIPRANALVSIFMIVGLLSGCNKGKTPGPDFVPDPRGWFIASYDNGIITAEHEGYTYQATCDRSRSFNNAGSVTDPKNVADFPGCDVAIGLVGHNVQPFEGRNRSRDGWIVNMWAVGGTLALRRWRDEKTPWRQEEFKITAVKPAENASN